MDPFHGLIYFLKKPFFFFFLAILGIEPTGTLSLSCVLLWEQWQWGFDWEMANHFYSSCDSIVEVLLMWWYFCFPKQRTGAKIKSGCEWWTDSLQKSLSACFVLGDKAWIKWKLLSSWSPYLTLQRQSRQANTQEVVTGRIGECWSLWRVMGSEVAGNKSNRECFESTSGFRQGSELLMLKSS